MVYTLNNLNQKQYAKNLSYPARSTKWSLARLMVADPGSRDEMWIVKMQCDLVDAWFMGVCELKHCQIFYLITCDK